MLILLMLRVFLYLEPRLKYPTVLMFRVRWRVLQTAHSSDGRIINKNGKESDCIIKLEIPETAKRSSATSRKCRADKVKVLEIQHLNGRKYPADTVAFPLFKSPATDTQYVVGKITKCSEKFETNRWKECASGIHFFITYEEALKYGT